MREIKFRLWCNHPQKYYDQSFAIINGNPYYGANPINKDYVTCDINGQKETFYSDWAKFMPLLDCVLEQYIGLKNKNNIEIYEGDIVKFKANYTDKPCGWLTGKIVITEYNLQLHTIDNKYNAYDETDEFPYTCEIIGNIHQNPELLYK